MDALSLPLTVYFLLVCAVFCLYGLHRYWMVWLFRRTGGLRTREPEPVRFDELPAVTVQLPMFNEGRVAERVIEAACAIDYPRDHLQIQVLDDSTDESAETARRCCARLRRDGHDVEYRHRTNRSGYKAGALEAGLASAKGSFIAIFDADFVPGPEVLKETIHEFTDDTVGMVQMRWAHLNRDDSLLTRIQALCLDGHFVVEQVARARTGRWFNFNGTAGVWRRRCIEDAGGWQHDTLTEDTDLSYRAQLGGWRFRYLAHVTCPAELPPTMGALMTQQHRWNKGLLQTAIKLLPDILRSRAPRAVKVEAWFHLTSPLPFAAMLLLTLLVIPALLAVRDPGWLDPRIGLIAGVLSLGLGTAAAAALYLVSQRAQGHRILPTLLRVPLLMAVGIGLSALNTKAIVEALFGHRSPFVRTPKFNGAATSTLDPGAGRGRRGLPAGTVETALGVAMAAAVPLTLAGGPRVVGLPFLVLFAAGYLAVGLNRLRRRGPRVVAPGAASTLVSAS